MSITINWDNTDNKDFLKTLLRDVFDTTAKREVLVEYPNFVNDISVQDYYERRGRKAGLKGMSQLTDGQEIPLNDIPDPSTKDWTQVRYGLGFKITSGMKKFNRIGLMKDLTADLSKVMREEKDIIVNRLFNYATATTYATGFDGLALASDSHTCLDEDGTTYDNYGDASLGVSALQSAYIYFRTLVDDQGRTMVLNPDTLMVNPHLEFTAIELLQSSDKPHEESNTINAIKSKGLSYKVNARLTSSTSWAVMAKSNKLYDLFVFTSQQPDLVVKDAADTSRSTVVTSESWFTCGFGDPRAFYLGNS